MEVKFFRVDATCRENDLPAARLGLHWGVMHLVGKPAYGKVDGEGIFVHRYEFDTPEQREVFLKRAKARLRDPDIVLFELFEMTRWVPDKPRARRP